MASVKLRYEPDADDDVGKLWMVVETDRFSGVGFFWSYRDQVRELADRLKIYLLPEAAEATWGYGKVEREDVVLSLRVVPVNSTGDLIAEVQVADLHDLKQRVSATFGTTYAEIATFGEQLTSLTDGSANEALLGGR
jgi:hypothetical protein